ncbi:MAG: RDD family protein [Pyrinomonadaceae bacterium]
MKPSSAKAPLKKLRAPFSLRCGAILIDYVLLASLLALGTLVARMLGGGARTAGTSSETAGIIITIVIAVLDLGVFAGLTGLTIGKWSTGLRIERIDGAPLGIGRALLRHFVGYPLSFILLGLGFAVAALSSRGRTLHDLIAGTIVVREGPGDQRRS